MDAGMSDSLETMPRRSVNFEWNMTAADSVAAGESRMRSVLAAEVEESVLASRSVVYMIGLESDFVSDT